MPDYDAIVIGAGHNGLTAAAVMARGGLRVLCLEKNQFTGGMASTTELIRGYQFELAGSVQFPLPNEIYTDLGFDACPIFEPEVRSASIGIGDQAPMIFYTDLDRLATHLSEHLGLDAVLGLAEIMNWAQAPARALGRFEVRTPPKTLDEMFACATDEAEREAIRTAMFGTVMDVVDRYLPDPVAPRPDAGAPRVPVGQLHLPRALHAGQRDVHGVRAGVAGRRRGDVEGARRHRRHVRPRPRPVRGQRRRAPPPRPGRADPGGRRQGGRRRAGRWRHDHRAGGRVEPRRHADLHRADRSRRPARTVRPPGRCHRPPGRLLPDALRAQRAARADRTRTRCSTRASCARRCACSAPPRRCRAPTRRASGARCRPQPPVSLGIPSLLDPSLAPAGQARGERVRVLRADRRRPRGQGAAARRDGRADRGSDRVGGPQLPRRHRASDQLSRPTATS